MGIGEWGRKALKRHAAVVALMLILCLLASCGPAGGKDDAADAGTGTGADTGADMGTGTGTDPGADAGGRNDTGTGMPDDTDAAETPTGPAEPQESGNDADTPDNADQDASGMNAVDRLRNALQADSDPRVTGELIRLFLDYQGESHGSKGPYHRYELRLLPQFGPSKALDWDGLTVFIYHMANYFEHDEEGYYFFDRELFDKTAGRLLPGLEYKHRRSAYFSYKDGIYVATGWDMHGGVYYRLKSISVDGRGTFTASFDGFCFSELDYFGGPYDSVGENMKAMYDFVGDRNAGADFDEVLLEIFLRDDYDEILSVNEHLEITFRISSDPVFAFEYLSCAREYLDH